MRRCGLRRKLAAGRREESSRRLVRNLLCIGVLTLCAAFFFGCGGSSGSASGGGNQQLDVDAVDSGNLNPSENYTSHYETPWHNLINSKHYSGYLAVMFKPGTEMRLRNGRFISLPLDGGGQVGVESINESVISHGGVVRRGMDIPEETIEKALVRAEREGKKLHDWNLYYTIKVENPGHAEELYKELGESDVVEWIHPIPVPDVAEIGDIPGGGDGVTEQLYLDTEAATGGLNIYAAWDTGITGQGARIVDEEYNWNFDHEALPIDEEDIIDHGVSYPPGFDINDPKYVNHGTAVTGVIGANNTNQAGVTGVAHSSVIKLVQTDISTHFCMILVTDLLEDYAEGKPSEDLFVRPGDIILMEIQSPGPNTPADTGCTANMETQEPTYCLPEEAYYSPFVAIQDVTELGVIVVESGGNGGVDLGDPDAQATGCGSKPCPNLATDDSGAIMVAASAGGKDKTRPWWSNWGNRINAYGWGYDVVSSGYGDHPASDPEDPNKWYTTNFNGTSSAAALVAGAVALVQSYTKEFYKDIVPHKEVYLDAYQMRELIEQAGTAGDPGYNIGNKPDVGAMMGMVASGDVLPHVAPDTEALLSKHLAVAGIRYDMDRDGRAELISWDPLASENGAWKIDLSSVAPDVPDPHPDNYGAWDLVINIPSSSASTLAFPVVHDYDSDGDADLALYDSENGLWYIKYTPSPIPSPLEGEGEGGGGEGNPPSPPEGEGWGEGELEWDRIIDYSGETNWEPRSRPLAGDFNGDNFLDLAVTTSDKGYLLIDYGGIGHIEKQGSDVVYVDDFGTFDFEKQFLTDEQLDAAPAWAYLPAWYPGGILYRYPDGTSKAGKFDIVHYTENFEPNTYFSDKYPAIYGENDDILSTMTYQYSSLSPSVGITVKWDSGVWEMAFEGYWDVLKNFPPEDGYGNVLCMPIIADYNGDKVDDRAVKCGSTWKIAYMLPDVEEFRIIEMDDSIVSLPPYVYPGGIKYQDIVSIYNHYKYQLGCGKGEECTISDAVPPIGPHFAQCIKYWAPPPNYCWNK